MTTWTYIVVGGGSAGCVLAARLSENPRNKVLLLESGLGGKERLPLVSAPGGAFYLGMNRLFDWRYWMQPDPTCDNRVEMLNGGKLLGGGSSINGMMFVRGNRADYDEWARLGNAGWSYNDVLPYFRKIERTAIGADAYHGRNGPLAVDYAGPMLDVSRRFIDAAVEAGIPYNDDINGERQEGVSPTPSSASGGVRQSTALTYLRPAMRRPNLKVVTAAHAQSIIFDGRRATGVAYRRWGKIETACADKAVILSAGAVRSPQLLMVSGVGPGQHLRQFGIQSVHDLRGVGANHIEHPAVGVIYEVALPTWNRDLGLRNQIPHVLNWLWRKQGPAASAYSQAVAFLRTKPDLDRPDLQLSLIPIAVTFAGGLKRVDTKRNMLKVLINACQPKGRGLVELASARADDHPRIHPRLLDNPETVGTMLRGIEITRGIFAAPALKPYVVREETPGPGINDLEAWLRATTVDTVHPCGTCKMGQDPMAVVDARLRVHGVEGLRVADASIMPTITTGNTNAPTIMIAEKAAAMILEDQ